jgi:segregation and condensation protein B
MTDDVRDDEPAPVGDVPQPESATGEGAAGTGPESGTGAGEPGRGPEGEPGPPEALGIVEALLYASGKPASVEQLAEAAELEPSEVEEALRLLETACEAPGRGIRLDRTAGGVRLVSRPEHDFPVRRLLGLEGRTKLSMAALETLAIVAYRQPVTAPEVMELRGVNSSSSIRTLLDRKLITTAGRKEVVGTPFLYKTTKEFLVHFGLNDLSALPKPEELEAIYGLEPATPPEPAQVELFPSEDGEGAPDSPDDTPPPPDSPLAEPN